jgi:hypothetical protein
MSAWEDDYLDDARLFALLKEECGRDQARAAVIP